MERGCGTLREAGFADVKVTTRPLPGEYPNPSAAVETALACPCTLYGIAILDHLDLMRLREETTAAIIEVDDLHWKTEIHYYEATIPAD